MCCVIRPSAYTSITDSDYQKLTTSEYASNFQFITTAGSAILNASLTFTFAYC